MRFSTDEYWEPEGRAGWRGILGAVVPYILVLAVTLVALHFAHAPWWLVLFALVLAGMSYRYGQYSGRQEVAEVVRDVIGSEIMNGNAPQWMPVRRAIEVVLPK